MREHVRVQKRYSLEERARILANYQASGLSQREFVARVGISLACLSIWLRRERLERLDKSAREPSTAFVPVELKDFPSLAMPPVPGRIEIELPGKMLVRLPESYSQAEAVPFILQLRRGC